MMRITAIRELSVSLRGNIANAVVNFASHTVSVVAVRCEVPGHPEPVIGVAFNSIGRFAQSGLLQERFIPRLLAAPPEHLLTKTGDAFDPAQALACLMANEKPGGHGDRAAAVAVLELALWDLNAKLAGEPAWRTIARATGGNTDNVPVVPVYAAGGYYRDHADLPALRDELRGYQDAGYRAFKIKIGGASIAQDLARIDAACAVAGSPAAVAVDANGRFDESAALAYARALNGYGLRWLEEPCDPLDYAANAAVAEHYDGVLATGENLFSRQDVTNLVRYGGLRTQHDVLQMDPGLSYGLTEYLAMLRVLESHGHSRQQCLPHGGHLQNLHIVAALGLGGCEAYPGVFAPVGGFSADCPLRDGCVSPGAAPGFGLEQKPELQETLATLFAELSG